MNPGKLLRDLQEIDYELAKTGETLSHVEQQLSFNAELAQARTALRDKEEQLADLHRQLRETEYATEDMVAKLNPQKKKLYDGSIKSPKELAALKQQVDQLSEQISGEEEKSLELMDRIQSMEEVVASQVAVVKQLEQDWEKKQAELRAEKAKLEADLEATTKRRDDFAAKIDREHLVIYEAVRARKQGYAVAKIELGRCQGCRITLSMSDISRARASELVQCDSCGRILYLG